MGVVIRGAVGLCRLQENGNTRLLDLYGPNEVIHFPLSRHQAVEMEAISDAIVQFISQRELNEALISDPSLARDILAALTAQVSLNLDQIALIGGTPFDKLRYYLLRLIYRPFDTDRTVVSIRHHPITTMTINRTALAAYLGTSTTRLACMLRALEGDGVIRLLTPRHLEILEEAKLLG
ncbi:MULTISPECIES: Crp/Fnr family transcriptional regulator [unclassified Shinella]|uniref:Crp/Fnr family transcriptional regulator n=1 Tax=unclassified Shinella TaxID=2643062 RepID=UPI00234EA537|nr:MULTISPECIES: Crp/Fnr family transcriptional regulator [unclassified Shinella]MCO5148502.1 Crp/Fnr family transcriptional regulator [Shinella sp.]MDC7264575.1 Crp/Fnr family transcriptional regulator [Shinella sp. HY16]MDC7271472.1 Crp/Fnr family transcriptional regulator [Shinella sp. YZ44]